MSPNRRAMKLKVTAKVHEKVDWKALALKLQAMLETGVIPPHPPRGPTGAEAARRGGYLGVAEGPRPGDR